METPNQFGGREFIDSHEFYHWPEFKALAKRMGLAWDFPTTDLVIKVPLHGIVEIVHGYRATEGEPDAVETTTAHNERWKTFKPVAGHEPEGRECQRRS